jgi:hypothetical protein
MKRVAVVAALIATLSLVLGISAQAPCNFKAVEKQQAVLSQQVLVLRTNFLTFWNMAFPNGHARLHDNEAERTSAWNPKLDEEQRNAPKMNDGLGCIVFYKPNLPSLCAPPDVRAQLAMEALREDWENGKVAPKDSLLETIRPTIALTWAEEQTMFCILRPEADYISLGDQLQSCTPKDAK